MYHPGAHPAMMSNAHHPGAPGMPGYPSQSHPQYNHGAPHHAQLQERAPIPPTQSGGPPTQSPIQPPGPPTGQPGSHHGTPPSGPSSAPSETNSPNFQRTNHASPMVQPTPPNSQSAPRGPFPNPASTASPSSGSPMTQPQVIFESNSNSKITFFRYLRFHKPYKVQQPHPNQDRFLRFLRLLNRPVELGHRLFPAHLAPTHRFKMAIIPARVTQLAHLRDLGHIRSLRNLQRHQIVWCLQVMV